jgi:hypothetical protein
LSRLCHQQDCHLDQLYAFDPLEHQHHLLLAGAALQRHDQSHHPGSIFRSVEFHHGGNRMLPHLHGDSACNSLGQCSCILWCHSHSFRLHRICNL